MILSPRRSAPLRWAAAAVAAYLALGGVVLVAEGGNPEWFVHFGSDPARSVALPLAREVLGPGVRPTHLDGHDGQRFWVQARDPLLLDPETTMQFSDRPVYRSQRVLYPLLASPFRLAGEQALLYGLVLVNVLAIGAGTWAAARLACRRNAHRWAPLSYAAAPTVLLAFALDTADALAIACMVLAVDAVDRHDFRAASAACVLAALAKEPAVVVALSLGSWALIKRMPLRTAVLLAAPALAAVVAWGLYVRWRLDFPPTGVQELTGPFRGFREAWSGHWSPGGQWAQAIIGLSAIGLAVVSLWVWWRRRTLLAWIGLPWALMVPFFTSQVVSTWANAPRATLPLLTLLALELMSGRAREAAPAAPATLSVGH